MNRKELKQHYLENPKPMGVFQIRNLSSGKVFVGYGKDVYGKINSNKFQLQHGSHMNMELQKDFTSSGEQNFSFDVIDTLEFENTPDKDYTNDLETLLQIWIDKIQPFGTNGYHKQKQI